MLSVDGAPIPITVQGTDGTSGALAVASCGAPLTLTAGRHELVAAPGTATGLDLDQLVLTSAAGGTAAADPGSRLGAPPPDAGARVRVVDSGETSFDTRVRTDGRPFWFVLGQSLSDGWELQTASGHSLGRPELVDGFANGWLVTPDHAGTLRLELRWTPQRLAWWGLGLSIAAVLVCLALIVLTWRRRRAGVGLTAPAFLCSPLRYPGTPPPPVVSLLTALGVGVVAGLVSRPIIGVGVGAASLVASRIPSGRVLLTIGAPVALLAAKAVDVPELGWVAILLLGADLVVGHAWAARAPGGGPAREARGVAAGIDAPDG